MSENFNMFDGMEDADIFDRGKFITQGFSGLLMLKATISKKSRKSGLGFIAEFEVLENNSPEEYQYIAAGAKLLPDGSGKKEVTTVYPLREHPVGTKCSWWQGMRDQDVALSSLAEFLAVLVGYDKSDKARIKAEVLPESSKQYKAACGDPKNEHGTNPLVGLTIRVRTEHIITQTNGRDFTRHDWTPAS